MPIGTAEVEITDSAVRAVITFAQKGISQIADTFCGLCKTGVLRGVSIGFNVIDQVPRQGGGFLIKAWKLLELSLVSIPANPNALIYARGYGCKSIPVPVRRKSFGRIIGPSSRPLSREQRLAIVANLRRPAYFPDPTNAHFCERIRKEEEAKALHRFYHIDLTPHPTTRAERIAFVERLRRAK